MEPVIEQFRNRWWFQITPVWDEALGVLQNFQLSKGCDTALRSPPTDRAWDAKRRTGAAKQAHGRP
jgi:hypothetical protein